jgi:hypothetical protein
MRRALTGIGNKQFDKYILRFRKTYREFNETTGQPVLLYALEFKFLRHSYDGLKYPTKAIQQDTAKLRLLRETQNYQDLAFNFVEKTKAFIFITNAQKNKEDALRKAMKDFRPEEYEFVTREPARHLYSSPHREE